jgi:hypothetical protein
MKRPDWFEILLIVVILSISLYAAFADGQNFSWRWFTRDDAYYYFKVAQNISEGHGSTFDGINRTNGYHPLWMLVLIPIFALARFDLVLPLRLLFLVLSGLSLGTGILLYRLVGKVFAPVIGAFAALYWIFSLTVLFRVYKQGLETGIAAFFIVLLLYRLLDFESSWRRKRVTRNDLMILGAISALVIFSRLDLIFLAAFVGLWVVFRASPVRYLMPLDIVSFAFSILLAFVIKTGVHNYYVLEREAVITMVVSLAIKVPLAYLPGLYLRDRISRTGPLLLTVSLFTVTSSAVLGVVMLALARRLSFVSFPRITLVYDAIATFVLVLLVRLLVDGLKASDPVSGKDSPLQVLICHWKQWLADGVVYYGVSFGPLLVYMLWSRFTFGTTSPVSGQIKNWWGSLSGNVYGGSANTFWEFFGITYKGDANAWDPVSTQLGFWAEKWRGTYMEDVWRYMIILAVFALVFYGLLLINKNKARTAIARLSLIPLLCGAIFQVFYYHMQSYSAYKEWYWVAQLILIVLVVSLILGMLYTAFHRLRWFRMVAVALVTFYGAYLVVTYGSYIQGKMTHGEWAANEPYMEISAFLEQHTEPGSIIGMTGGGNAAYFIRDRTIINMDGLINSYQYFQLLKEKEAGKYLAELGMNYVLANNGMLKSLPYRGQYQPYLQPTEWSYGGKELSHYHAPQP